MAGKTAQAIAEVIQIVNFRLGDEEFGVDITSVREITRVTDITRIPESSSFIQGVMNLRGQVIAVIDLARQFGVPPREELSPSARIVVTEIGRHTIGILVDEVPEVAKLTEEDIESAPEAIQSKGGRDYIKGIGKLGERLIVILDLEKVLAAREVEEVAKITEK
jgi:purine-binding chemotaxis protein CheW